MDGHASNADDAETVGEASPRAGGNADGRLAHLGDFILQGEADCFLAMAANGATRPKTALPASRGRSGKTGPLLKDQLPMRARTISRIPEVRLTIPKK
jgi:hypothetical protein